MPDHDLDPEVANFLSELSSGSSVSVAHIVDNSVRVDSRVIKSAQVSAALGYTTVVFGVTTDEVAETFDFEGIRVVLLPYYRNADRAALERAWRSADREITAYRALRHLKLRKWRAFPFPSAIMNRKKTPIWADARPMSLNVAIALKQALRFYRPSIIHVHDTIALPAAVAHAAHVRLRRQHVSVIYDAHECIVELARSYPSSLPHQAFLYIEQAYIRDASRVITVSDEISLLLRESYRLDRLPDVVANAPSKSRDAGAPCLRKVIGLSDDVPLAVYSGSVSPERGLDVVLRALLSLPSLHLAIVCGSNNNTTAKLVKQARALGIWDRVHFAPYVPSGQVTSYLSSATVGLLPLRPGRHLELSLPTKFREYLHAGLPIIVSDHEAMAREINRTRVGRVFRAGNVGGLALQLSRVIESPNRYRAQISKTLLKQHSWETQARVLAHVYRNVRAPIHTEYGPEIAESQAVSTNVPYKALKFTEAEAPAVRQVEPELMGLRLGIGRANSAGQAYFWCESVRAELSVPSESFAPHRAICHAPHKVVARLRPGRTSQHAAEFGRIIGAYSHILIDGFESISGEFSQWDLGFEIKVLRRHGIAVGLVAHGSDVRDPAAHALRFPGSYFDNVPRAWRDEITARAAENRRVACASGVPLYVSTPDLLHDLPNATWLPVVADQDVWRSVEPPVFSAVQRPRVLHRPSRATPPIKGSDVIVPVLQALDADGLISYIPDSVEVAAHEMVQLVESADIVVDQIRTGSYGVAAVEAMFAGRAVVGNVMPEVRDVAGDVPIVDVTPETLRDELIALAADPQRRKELASQGPEFATRWHNGRESALALRRFLAG